jgi:hypothetical protein
MQRERCARCCIVARADSALRHTQNRTRDECVLAFEAWGQTQEDGARALLAAAQPPSVRMADARSAQFSTTATSC